MPLLHKDGNKLAHAALEFSDFPNFQLQGFTICEDEQKRLFVLFPSTKTRNKQTGQTRMWFFLRPTVDNKDEVITELENQILDVYETMTGAFNKPRIVNVVDDNSNKK